MALIDLYSKLKGVVQVYLNEISDFNSCFVDVIISVFFFFLKNVKITTKKNRANMFT